MNTIEILKIRKIIFWYDTIFTTIDDYYNSIEMKKLEIYK